VGKHEPELVENYYGPAETVAAVEAEESLEPARLVEEARALLADLDGATSSRSGVRGSPGRRGRC
jgi:hypothetical protein